MTNKEVYIIALECAEEMNINCNIAHGCYFYKNNWARLYISNLQIKSYNNQAKIQFQTILRIRNKEDKWVDSEYKNIISIPISLLYDTLKKEILNIEKMGFFINSNPQTKTEILNRIQKIIQNLGYTCYNKKKLLIQENKLFRIYITGLTFENDSEYSTYPSQIISFTWVVQEQIKQNVWVDKAQYKSKCKIDKLDIEIFVHIDSFKNEGYLSKTNINDIKTFNKLLQITKKHLNINTENINFEQDYEISIWRILNALNDAYIMGKSKGDE